MLDWNFDGEINGMDYAMNQEVFGHAANGKRKAKSLPIKSVNKNAPKASEKQVKEDLASYVTKHVFSKNSIDASDVSAIVKLLKNKYGNITLWLMEDYNDHPIMRIKIKHFLLSEELNYEIRVNGKRNKTTPR